VEEVHLRDQLRAWNPAAFRALCDQHGPAMYSACLRVLGDRAAADDALQEAFVLAYRRRDQVADAASIRAYLLGISRHVALDVVRKQRRRDALHEANRDDLAPPSPGEDEVDVARLDALRECLEAVPAATRTAVELHFWQGRPWAEIADATGVAIDTVRMRVKRALTSLLDCLRGKGVTA
jgi:RNA polymerase sigma-70 factor (ECF subfamily)